jgi:TusA-related sulfurtransferase
LQKQTIKEVNDDGSARAAFKVVQVDACGLQCPGPILKMKKVVDKLTPGEQVEIIATDPGFLRDAAAWRKTTYL